MMMHSTISLLTILLAASLDFCIASSVVKQDVTYVQDRKNPNRLPICALKPEFKSGAPCENFVESTTITINPKQLFQISCAGFGLYELDNQLGDLPCFIREEYVDERCISKSLSTETDPTLPKSPDGATQWGVLCLLKFMKTC